MAPHSCRSTCLQVLTGIGLLFNRMVLVIGGMAVDEAPNDSRNLFHAAPHLKEAAAHFSSISPKIMPSQGLLYLHPREYAAVMPQDSRHFFNLIRCEDLIGKLNRIRDDIGHRRLHHKSDDRSTTHRLRCFLLGLCRWCGYCQRHHSAHRPDTRAVSGLSGRKTGAASDWRIPGSAGLL